MDIDHFRDISYFVGASVLLGVRLKFKLMEKKSHLLLASQKLYPPTTGKSFTTSRTGKFYTSDPCECVEPLVDKEGANSLAPMTTLDMFKDAIRKHGSQIALALKRGENVGDSDFVCRLDFNSKEYNYFTLLILFVFNLCWLSLLRSYLKGKSSVDVEWKTWTYDQYWSDSMAFAKSVLAQGLENHSVINIIGFNSVCIYLSYHVCVVFGL